MKRFVSVGMAALLFALMSGISYGSTAEGAHKPSDSQGRVVTIKTEIAETLITTPIVSVLEGTEAQMAVQTAMPKDADKGNGRDETAITWTPTITNNGSINLVGSLKFSRRGYQAQDVKLSATVKPGESQKLPVVMVPTTNGANKLQLTLAVTAVVQDPSKK